MPVRLSRSLLIVAIAVALGATAGGAVGAPAKAVSLLREINRARTAHHLRALRLDPRLTRAADVHSRAMARTRVLVHTRPLLLPPGSRAAGENLARIPGDRPQAVVAAWLASPPHRANLLSVRFTSIGVADVAGLVTADFAG
jgi:uncharacterized protein YkwD